MDDFIFDIEDKIDNLSIMGKGQFSPIDKTGEYDISFYENLLKNSAKEIKNLVDINVDSIAELRDRNTQLRILKWTKKLVDVYQNLQQVNPREEYENSNYSQSKMAGYYQTHPYAEFINRDFVKKADDNYSKIIKFMNDIYTNYEIYQKNGNQDTAVLYKIFENTKNTCQRLGIKSITPSLMTNIIIDDPYNQEFDNIIGELDILIDDENRMNQDIIINSLPYTITAPRFSFQGPDKYELAINKGRISYNKKYIDKIDQKNNQGGQSHL